MPFDQPTRNLLARFVGDARALLTEEFTRQLQQEYGLDPERGEATDLSRLGHLDDARRATALLLRETLAYYLAGQPKPDAKDRREALDRIVREQAFTILNRLCALRMAEGRGLLIESVGQGHRSQGFQLYSHLAGTGLGETGDAYRCYLFSLFDELALELPVLFDRYAPEGRLFPREVALSQVLALINAPEIAPLWAEDETIGWLYQYFNSRRLRDAVKQQNKVPSNSYELAIRSSYYTPRFVVSFLTDNTLGRIWYEMTQGQTSLKETCRYLIRRPTEIFLAEGEEEPLRGSRSTEDSEEEESQEELLRQPVYIPHRPIKDPRDILMLDPACGSLHFGLYAFDLYERIYDEAWELEGILGSAAFIRSDGLLPLRESYPDKTAFLADVPRLIIERNIHGIDIDPRAVQIAGVSLWLRAQRSWQAQGIKPQDRPQIRRSNVVCAEPMPGDRTLLDEFAATLQPRVLGHLVATIFDKMELAGEAGSLLRIEEEIEGAIEAARAAYGDYLIQQKKEAGYLPGLAPDRPTTLLDFTDLPEEKDFWDRAEARVLGALEEYAEGAENDHRYRRRLFAGDAARGFAFIDLSRKRYDIVLMNPPFAETEGDFQVYLRRNYPENWTNLYSAFIERSMALGSLMMGIVCPDGLLSAYRMKNLRKEFLSKSQLKELSCLGKDVFDEMGLSTVAMTVCSRGSPLLPVLVDLTEDGIGRVDYVDSAVVSDRTDYVLTMDMIRAGSSGWNETPLSPRYGLVTKGNCTFDDFRFIRAWWEVPPAMIHSKWQRWQKGGEYQPFFSSTPYVMEWNHADYGAAIRAFGVSKVGTDAQVVQSSRYWWLPGLVGPALNTTGAGFNVRVLPERQIFSAKSTVIIPKTKEQALVLLCLLNSSHARLYLYQQGAGLGGNTGKLKKVPIVWPGEAEQKQIESLSASAIQTMRALESFRETSPIFTDCIRPVSPLIEQYRECAAQIDEIAATLYSHADVPAEVRSTLSLADSAVEEATGGYASEPHGRLLVSYCVGVAFGRWDLSAAVAERAATPDPRGIFSPLPVCPPGMLQDDQGLPATDAVVPSGYPVRVSWSGILVDDEGHLEDIVRSVRNVFRVIWPDSADIVELEVCNSVGCTSLRDYFGNPAKFFDNHMRQYSKSQRVAPIYQPLSTSSCSYTLWLYYQRLTDQTLYICVNDFVDPRLKQVSDEASRLRQKRGRSSADEKELERLVDLELELKDFRAELLRIAAFWKPDINDGVQITAAPLWRLFQHRPWQKTLKETWESLERGEYDWAHLAMSIWPERVVPKCVTDRSLAIAHDVEDLFVWVEDGGRWRNLNPPEEELAEQVRRQQRPGRDQLRSGLAALTMGEGRGLRCEQVYEAVATGKWDDLTPALLLWPERVAQKCWDDPLLAQTLKIDLPTKRTKAARERFVTEQMQAGCADLAEALGEALADRADRFASLWAELARGDRDELALALALWPDRVVDECAKDAELAERHGVRRFLWVKNVNNVWRRRKAPQEEVANEIGRRRGVA